MKARILTAVLLMLALTTFAQTSRRGGEQQEKKSTTTREAQNNNSNRTYQKPQNTTSREAVKPSNNSRPATNNQTVTRRDNNNTRPASNNQTVTRRDDNNTRPATNNQTVTRRDDNNTRPATNNQTVEKRDNNNNRGYDNNNQVNNNRGYDNKNSGNTRDNNNRGYGNNNQKHGGNTRVIVRDGRTYHREYVHIVRPQRKVIIVHNRPGYHHHPIEYRRVHYPYRIPRHHDIIWTVSLYNDFRIFYPEIRYWRYDIGYRLPVIPAYDAELYIGDVARVYGKVHEVFYDYDSDNYFLYIGDYYPYHDFSVVIPGHEARRFTRRPERYFEGSHIAVTGYITDTDNKPEIVVRRASQIDLY